MNADGRRPARPAGGWSDAALVGAVVAGALAAVALGGWDAELGIRALRLLAGCCAVVIVVVSSRRARRRRDVGWAALAVFGAVWALNRFGALLAGASTPRGSMGGPLEGLWVLGVPAAFVGLGLLCFGGLSPAARWRVLADSMVVATAWWFLGWVVGSWFAPPGTLSRWDDDLLVPLLLGLAAALTLTAAVHQPGHRRLRWTAAAVVALAVGDTTVTYLLLTGQPTAVPLAYAAFTVGTLCAVLAVAGEDPPVTDPPLTSLRRRLVAVPMVLAVVVALVEVAGSRRLAAEAALLLVAVLAAAVVGSQALLAEVAATVARLRTGEARLRALLDHAPVGIALTDDQGRLIEANPAIATLTGRPLEELLDRPASCLVLPEGAPAPGRTGSAAPAAAEDPVVADVVVTRPDGEERWARTVVTRLPHHDPPRLIAVALDVTQRRRAEDRLRFLARHDPLTGLLNRPALEEELAAAVAGSSAERPAAVVHIDLDQFKVINDSLGHGAGDRLLGACALRLRAAAGTAAAVARFGSDEFSVVLRDRPIGELPVLVERLAAVLREPVEVGQGERSWPTASIGVATWYPGATAMDLLAAADAAMHRSKDNGRNRTEWFESADRARVEATHRVVQDLHHALDHGELVVHYQPVADAATGVATGAEALVRWRHPTRGLLAPGAFLPAAESSGLMVPLGEQVLAAAADEAARWTLSGGAGGPLSVAVNVAAQQLLEPGFPAVVDRVLTESGLAARRLWLELTETTLMADSRTIGATLGSLRGMGVRFALDDFGTGYSSLTYLKRFPVERLKIDRSFVTGLGIDTEDTAIVAALVDLGHRLGLRVVAEGVETPLQLEVLRDLGCDLVQGYLLAPPLPAVDVRERLGLRQPAPVPEPTPRPD